MNIKTPFALRFDKVIHVSELADIESRKEHECYCCSCKEKLIAKLGPCNRWHFSHSNSKCTNSLETGLHLIAKKILSHHKHLMLPELCIFSYDLYIDRESYSYDKSSDVKESGSMLLHDECYRHDYVSYKCDEKFIICKEQLYSFDSVIVEERIDNIIGDIVLYKNNKPLLVEIAVTHFIDNTKFEKIKNMKLSSIEIDLSSYKNKFLDLNLKELERLIISSVNNRKWIYNDKAENKILECIEGNKLKDKISDSTTENYRIKQGELREQNKALKQSLLEIEDTLKIQYELDKSKSILWQNIVKRSFIDINNIADFIDSDIQGDIVFACHKNIWQAAIFDKFISNKKHRYLSKGIIARWILNDSKIPLNKPCLTSDVLVKDISILENIVQRYLSVLVSKGIVELNLKVYKFKIDSYRSAMYLCEKMIDLNN